MKDSLIEKQGVERMNSGKPFLISLWFEFNNLQLMKLNLETREKNNSDIKTQLTLFQSINLEPKLKYDNSEQQEEL